MKIRKIIRILLFCGGVSIVIAYCSKDTLFDPNSHTLSLPFAFVSLTMQNPSSLSDTAGLATIDTVPKGADVYFIGLVSKPQQQIKASWNFGDNQTDTLSIIKRSFSHSGIYHAYYSVWDQVGNSMADSVTVFVYALPIVDALLFPQNGDPNVIPSDSEGILFRWHISQSDSGEMVLSNLLIGTNPAAFDTIAKDTISNTIVKDTTQSYYYPLLPSTTYYWRVVLKSRYGGTYSSVIDSFTTANQAIISKPIILSTLRDTTVKVMDTLQFYAQATDSGSTIAEYAWDFNGDKTFDTAGVSLSSCMHAYQTTGTYRAVLRVTDQNGKTADTTIRIIVTPITPTDKPVIQLISRDTTIKLLDSMLLYAIVTDANDIIIEYAWDFNGDGAFDTIGVHADSCVHRFANEGAFNVVFRATDQNGLYVQDTVKVNVRKEKLLLNFTLHDTVVDFGGTVRCSIRVNNTTSNLSFAVDTGHNGTYIPMKQSGPSASYSFSTGTASSWDSVKMRVTSPSSDTLFAGFKVDVRPRPLTITGIDSTDTTITVHWNQSLETDFREYKLYRNLTSSVDTTGELVDTITQANTVSYTVHVPNFIPVPRYYRLYQKDNEGVLSAGSNVVFGNIKSFPPSQPVIIAPATDNDSLLSNATIRWRRSIDPRGDSVTYVLQINADTGYKTIITGTTDTFFTLKNYDTLSLLANIKVIASNNKGASSSSERLNIRLKKAASGIMRRVVAGKIIDDQSNTASISHDFFMDTTEVTLGAYKAIMPFVPIQTNAGNLFPVQNISWFEAIMYCNALSKQANLDTMYTYTSITADGVTALDCNWDKMGYRLPTEDEWELAAKGGANLTYATDSGTLSCKKANYGICGINGTEIAGIYPPNPYGLHDLTGNISEWCWDRYVLNPPNRTSGRIDFQGPTGFSALQARSVRGGSFADRDTTVLETSNRSSSLPTSKYADLTNIGFRCIRLAP